MKTFFRGPAALWFILGSSLFASLPPTFTPQEIAQGYSDTTILARPRDNADDPTISSAETREGLSVRERFPRFGHLRVLNVPSGETPLRTIKRLRATGRYAYVEPNRLLHSYATPNDPSFSTQWSLNNTGANSGTAGADIRALTAWDTLTDASSVVVAVIDSGARLTHSDLAANFWSSTDSGHVGTHGISAIGGSGAISNYTPDDTDVGHGTHVSGIIGAVGNNGAGISGVAWKAQLMELRYLHGTEGTGSTADAIACLNFAIQHGVKVINASYGSSVASNSELTALKAARDAGIVFVAAAGNDGTNNDTVPAYPAAYALDNIVAVAATNRTDKLSSFSDYGAGSVDLAAPGESIYSTFNDTDSAYASESGTSMAAPHVTGAIALLRARFPADTYRQSINRLLRSATPLATLTGKVQTGGRLNLAAALASADNRPFNDDFSTRATLSGGYVRVRASNIGATAETGEPAHAGAASSHSLWWSWIAPASTSVVFDTSGSAYDTVVAVYTGSSVGALTAVGSNDDASGATTSRLLVNVTAGTTYQIAVDGKNGATGYTALKLGAVPTNDNFAAAKTLTGSNLRESSTTLNASRESGEPDPTALGAGHSVWFKWTAPATGHCSLAAYATTSDTIAAVYTGSSLSALTTVASNDDNANSTNSDALVSFTANAGTTYYFQVDHAAADVSDGGDFIFTLTDSVWEFPALDEITSSPAIGADGTIYFGAGSSKSYDTNLYAVNPDGSKKWSFTTTATSYGIMGGGPAIAADGTIYVGSYDARLYALNSTGSNANRLRWSYTTDSPILSTPAVGADGSVYVRNDTKLYALSSSGGLKWTYTLNTAANGGSYASPIILADGTILIGTTGGSLYALTDNINAATTKWTFTATGDIYTTPAVAADGTIYFGTIGAINGSATGITSGRLYAITPGASAATLKWSITLPTYTSTEDSSNNGTSSSPAIGADGTVYFAAYDHKLYALAPSSGAIKWSTALGDETRASSPIIGSDGTVYLGNYDGSVYAVSAAGAIVRTFPSALKVRSSPVIGGNRLYFGSADGKLHAFDLGQTNLASPWPMFHQNTLRNGRVGTGAITLSAQSSSKAVAAGSALTLSVTATSTATLSYQWYKNGAAISGATAATYAIASAANTDAATYKVVVSSSAGSITSDPIVVNVVAAGTLPSTFADIATRAYCGTGNNVTIGGFVVSGSASKRVLIRAVGPSLTSQGIGAAEVLADPVVEVHPSTGPVITNDNWADNANAAEITAAGAQLGATALLGTDAKSAALLLTLSPGVYSFVVTGKNNSSGIVLLEVYDADGTSPVSTFSNISSRAYATTGNGVAIGGFVISGSLSKTVLIRAVGPTLTTQGISQAEALADPVIELHRPNDTTLTNDDWSTNDNANAIVTTGARIGATPFATSDTKSAALLLTLQPGVYSFIASSKSNTSGIVLVEIYDAD